MCLDDRKVCKQGSVRVKIRECRFEGISVNPMGAPGPDVDMGWDPSVTIPNCRAELVDREDWGYCDATCQFVPQVTTEVTRCGLCYSLAESRSGVLTILRLGCESKGTVPLHPQPANTCTLEDEAGQDGFTVAGQCFYNARGDSCDGTCAYQRRSHVGGCANNTWINTGLYGKCERCGPPAAVPAQ